MTKRRSRSPHIALGKTIFLFLLFSPAAWSSVFIRWRNADLPSASSLGVSDVVFAWSDGIAPLMTTARKQGYRVYVEAPIQQAKAAAEGALNAGCAGIIVDATSESDSAKVEDDVARLRPAYPKLTFRVLNANGKQPDMRGSLIVKRNSILEVSSPTAQPWIDTNLALIKIEERSRPAQIPLYTFSWDDQTQQRTFTADDYSLAVAEAGAFHADLVLQVDEHLQQGLNHHDADAWALWNQVRSTLKFSLNTTGALEPAANVAVVDDHLDTSDEVLNLLSRHNIPFRVFLPADLRSEELKSFDVVVVLTKPDQEIAEKIRNFATRGATVVVVNSLDRYPWQNSQPVQVNEHTTSYTVGSGKILDLSEPVTDPETFAQDIRRLLGKRNSLLSLWNGLTTIVVPYQPRGGSVTVLELVNYAAEPVRVQVQVKGSFKTVRYESPDRACCESLVPVQHDGFTEFVIPELRIAGRIHLESH